MARLTVSQILEHTPDQVRKTKTEELKRQTQTLIDRNRKTVERLLKDPFGSASESAQRLVEYGLVKDGKFNASVKGLEKRSEIKALFDQMRIIAKSKQYNLREESKLRHRVEKRTGKKFENPDDYRKFWKAYRETEEDAVWMDSTSRQRYIAKELDKASSWEEIVARVEKGIQGDYEQQEAAERKGERNFFTLDDDEEDIPY